MWFPRTMSLGCWHFYNFLQCPESQYFFFSLFHSLCFLLDLTVLFLLCFPRSNSAWSCLSSGPHVTSFSFGFFFFFLRLCWTKTGDKAKAALHFTFKSFLTCFIFDLFHPIMQSYPVSVTESSNSFPRLCLALFQLHSLSFLRKILPSCPRYQSHEF